MDIEINEYVARKVLETVDAGLVRGMGVARPGSMCVEAAVCYALGLPHWDRPPCVNLLLREFKIVLNDTSAWPSNEARAKGLRRLAIAQLGSSENFDELDFARRLRSMYIKKFIPNILRHTITFTVPEFVETIKNIAEQIENGDGSTESVNKHFTLPIFDIYPTIHEAEDILYIVSRHFRKFVQYPNQIFIAIPRVAYRNMTTKEYDYEAKPDVANKLLLDFAEEVVQILIEMNAPGTKWLYLTEVGKC